MNSPYMGKFRISQLYKGVAHDGLDLVGVDSKTIHSTVNGVVLYAGWENSFNHRQGFGQYVKIRRTGTQEVYYFGHLSSLLVKTGDTVRITDPIGIEGSTGRSTGSHLHYCMRMGDIKGQHRDINRISGIPNVIGTYDDGYVSRMQHSSFPSPWGIGFVSGRAQRITRAKSWRHSCTGRCIRYSRSPATGS